MRSTPKDQRLAALEQEFDSLLVPCLKECANGRWGLFGQNQQPEAARFLRWSEAERLKELAEEIREIRGQFGRSNPNCERLLEYCFQHDANLPGEPKRARKFLEALGEDW